MLQQLFPSAAEGGGCIQEDNKAQSEATSLTGSVSPQSAAGKFCSNKSQAPFTAPHITLHWVVKTQNVIPKGSNRLDPVIMKIEA